MNNVEIEVTCAGFILASLLSDIQQNLKTDQLGFLFGEIIENCVKKTTDTDDNLVHTQTQINIQGTLLINKPFFNHAGCINSNEIRTLIACSSNIVGWFYSRGTNNIKLGNRAKLVHKALLNYINIQSDLFVTCLLMNNASNNKATHNFTQQFYRYDWNSFIPIPLNILNVGDVSLSYKVLSSSKSIINELWKKTKHSNVQTPLNQLSESIKQHIHQQLEKIVELNKQLENVEDSQNAIDASASFDNKLEEFTNGVNSALSQNLPKNKNERQVITRKKNRGRKRFKTQYKEAKEESEEEKD